MTVENFQDLPNYVGDNLVDGLHEGITFNVNIQGAWNI